ncbi:MAG: hypothetical protein MZV64_49470 [Ignavibacteriales bacterium]|nr:hypothetical protein [Ignavibacteriales bacterium]
MAAVARRIVGDATEPMEQLERLYAEVQGFRNLSYEKDLTEERKRTEDQGQSAGRRRSRAPLRPAGDLTRTFVKLARRPASRPRSSASRPGTTSSSARICFPSTISSIQVALVKPPAGRSSSIPPPFCPFGLIHWARTNSTGLRISDDPPAFSPRRYRLPAWP